MLRVPTLYAALHKFAMGIIAPHKRLARCLSKSGGTGSGFRWRSIISYVFRIPSYHGDDRRAFEVTAVSLESSSAILVVERPDIVSKRQDVGRRELCPAH